MISDSSFTLTARDPFNNTLVKGGDAVSVHAAAALTTSVLDNGDGTYRVGARAVVAGRYTVEVRVGEASQANLTLLVQAAKPFPSACVLSGAGLQGGQVGVEATFGLDTFDRYGNIYTSKTVLDFACIGVSSGVFLGPSKTEHRNGSYSFAYTAKALGAYTCSSKMGAALLAFNITLGPGPVSAAKTAATIKGTIVPSKKCAPSPPSNPPQRSPPNNALFYVVSRII